MHPLHLPIDPLQTQVEKDHVYYWCSCGESAHESQPWCDQVGCKDTKPLGSVEGVRVFLLQATIDRYGVWGLAIKISCALPGGGKIASA